jgi:hypothetical protein
MTETSATSHPERLHTADIAAATWVALIYSTIPVVRVFQEWFVARWDKSVIGYAVVVVLLVAAGFALHHIRRGTRRPSVAAVTCLLAVAAGYLWWTSRLWQRPEEAVHLLEYGVLGILLHRALRVRVTDATVFVSAAILGALVGTVDEIIQWITPDRYWDFRDILINGGSCALSLVAMSLFQPPSGPIRTRSLRLPTRLAAAQLLLLALCISNTPTRVAWYTERIPGLGFLQHPTNDMIDYGHRHVFAPVGEFRSRFTIDELTRTDAERYIEAGAILTRYPSGRYGRFLKDFPAARDPFIHEARVHIYSRDLHIADRRDHPEGSRARRRHSTVARREHQILERFFPKTFAASPFGLAPGKLKELERDLLPDYYFNSKAGIHLITRISENALRQLLLIPALTLLVLDRIFKHNRS